MPLRVRRHCRHLRLSAQHPRTSRHPSLRCQNASLTTAAAATIPAPSINQMNNPVIPIQRFPHNQPPSHKAPELRKSQLHRQYTSLLRSSPLVLILQHNNLLAGEWLAIRRELTVALRRVDEERAAAATTGAHEPPLADLIRIQIVQTHILAAVMRVIEFFDPAAQQEAYPSSPPHPTDPSTSTSADGISNALPYRGDPRHTHFLSRTAYEVSSNRALKHELEPLLCGPIALIPFPAVSPAHLHAVLSILFPRAPDFPAPRRRVRPSYHAPEVQKGLKKLMLLAARVEGRVFDESGVRWVGGIQGGIDGLRAQLVAMLQGIGGGVTSTLEGASRSLYFAMEGRREMLEEEQKGKSEKDGD